LQANVQQQRAAVLKLWQWKYWAFAKHLGVIEVPEKYITKAPEKDNRRGTLLSHLYAYMQRMYVPRSTVALCTASTTLSLKINNLPCC
jgi:hypothetical protein